MSKKRVGTGLLLSIVVVAVWFLVVPIFGKHLVHPPANLRLIVGVALGEVGILIALFVGILTDGGQFRFSLSRPNEKKWIDGAAIPLVLIWHFLASIVFAVVYFLVSGHQLPNSSPVNADFRTLGHMSKVLLVLTAFIAAGCAALVEEFYFRGYLISRLSRLGLPPITAGIVAGILFALLHVPGYGFLVSLPKFIGLGLFAGVYVGLRGRLWPMIVAHFIIDFAGLLALGFLTVQ